MTQAAKTVGQKSSETKMPASLVSTESVAQCILLIRGQKVMLDADLAELFGVPTKVFNQAIRRNLERFPADFMFQPTENEKESLRSQFVTLKTGRGQHRKYLPYVFTEPNTARSWRRQF